MIHNNKDKYPPKTGGKIRVRIITILLMAAAVLFLLTRVPESCDVCSSETCSHHEVLSAPLKTADSHYRLENEKSALSTPPPKLLLYSFIHPEHLYDTAQFWGTKTGFSGFMIAYICDWPVSQERMLARVPRLTEINLRCKEFGIDSNFIKISMGHLKDLNWTDEEQWQELLDHIKTTAYIAKETGFVGIAIDTEPYHWKENSIWDKDNPLYEELSEIEIKELVQKRGLSMMDTILKEFPRCEFIIFPEGCFYYRHPEESTKDTAALYNLWGSFLQGLREGSPPQGIIIGTERTYHVTRPAAIKKFYKMIDEAVGDCLGDKTYLREKGSIALGAAPLGKTWFDKSPRYSLSGFKTQMETFARLSTRYVWIYGHGAAWWKLDSEAQYKDRGFTYWRPNAQIVEPNPQIERYYEETLRIFKTP